MGEGGGRRRKEEGGRRKEEEGGRRKDFYLFNNIKYIL